MRTEAPVGVRRLRLVEPPARTTVLLWTPDGGTTSHDARGLRLAVDSARWTTPAGVYQGAPVRTLYAFEHTTGRLGDGIALGIAGGLGSGALVGGATTDGCSRESNTCVLGSLAYGAGVGIVTGAAVLVANAVRGARGRRVHRVVVHPAPPP